MSIQVLSYYTSTPLIYIPAQVLYVPSSANSMQRSLDLSVPGGVYKSSFRIVGRCAALSVIAQQHALLHPFHILLDPRHLCTWPIASLQLFSLYEHREYRWVRAPNCLDICQWLILPD
jgi:hypothetical protein